MSELNKKQRELYDEIDGFIVVDAGPGTGKTSTIVQRYINVLNQGINPMKVHMLTFTNNAADQMKTKMTNEMSEVINEGHDTKGYLRNAINNLKVSTIDSFCLDIVMNSPDTIRDFFDPKDDGAMLSRNATLVSNDTLNDQYFADFYARFIREKGGDYISDGHDIVAAIGTKTKDLRKLYDKLMARGMIPLKKGWFGYAKDVLIGKRDDLVAMMTKNSEKVSEKMQKILDDGGYDIISDPEIEVTEMIGQAAYDDREVLLKFIHDVYYDYIVQSIKDNRLTFGLCELFAFIILLKNKGSRKMHSIDYLIIDEFQDTNELQMKICLMVLNKGNLCAVGDWKQGIFEFRFVSIDNIVRFGPRIKQFMEELSDAGIEFPFTYTKPKRIDFDCNYRSSSLILNNAFESLTIAQEDEDPNNISTEDIVELTSMNDEFIGDNTSVRCIEGNDKDDEIDKIVDMIDEFVSSGNYPVMDIHENEDGSKWSEVREMGFGDIAVLCRTGPKCKMVYDRCVDRGIPAFLQDDVDIMSSREGKLVLAWLRYLNDPNDQRGIGAILTDLHYPMSETKVMVKDRKYIPHNISKMRLILLNKLKRPNDLITSIFRFYNINNDTSHAIVNVLSRAHSDSLMTISDMIRLIEGDIRSETKYASDPMLNDRSVTIQTIHKSKGLEYAAVIVEGLIRDSFPDTKEEKEILTFSDITGVRCNLVHMHNDSPDGAQDLVLNSWRTALVKAGITPDYSEERRLLFVGMTRPKQYLVLTSYRSKKSCFFDHYQNKLGNYTPVPKGIRCSLVGERTERPVIGDYTRRRMSVSVHDLMDTITVNPGAEEREGKGKEYGDMVHEKAHVYLRWGIRDDSVDEMQYIANLIDSKKDAKLYGEIRCSLPVDDVSVKGTIDLMAEYDDRIEIHDYKTDLYDSYEPRYRLQLSIYALAAAASGKRVECYLHYVSQKKTVEIEPYPMSEVKEAVDRYKESLRTKTDEEDEEESC